MFVFILTWAKQVLLSLFNKGESGLKSQKQNILVLTAQVQIKGKISASHARRAAFPWPFSLVHCWFHLVTNARYFKEPWWFFPFGLGNPAFFFALGFMKHLEELRGQDSEFTVGLGQSLGGSTSRESSQGQWMLALFQREKAHFSLDSQEVISIKMYLKYLL